MASGQIVSIKITPYLKEYFIYRHGCEPIKASRETKFFMFMARYLEHKPVKWKMPDESDDTLLIELPYNEIIDVRNLCYISPKYYPEIKSYVYGLFYGAFISYMNPRVIKEHWSIKYSIVNFIDEHNMSWNKTNYETLKKIYDRYRHPEVKKINENISPNPATKKALKRPSSVPYSFY
jgi:hypothetical protein